MTVVSFVAVGVGPRTVGRQNAYSIALMSAFGLRAISVLLAPISRLLILLGNALTPGRGFPQRSVRLEIELREVVDLGPTARRRRRRGTQDDPVGVRTRRHPGA